MNFFKKHFTWKLIWEIVIFSIGILIGVYLSLKFLHYLLI